MHNWLGGTIRQRMVKYLAALAILSCIQSAATFWIEYDFHLSSQRQILMNRVSVRQMFGDMKHDAIQNDVLRINDHMDRGDEAAARQTARELEADIADLVAAYRFVIAQDYPADLRPEIAGVDAPMRDYVARARAAAAGLLERRGDSRAGLAAFGRSFKAFEDVQENLAASLKAGIEASAAADARASRIVEIIQFVAVALGGGGMAFTFFYTRNSVAGPIERLSQTLRQMAEGHYDDPISGYDNDDEITGMAGSARVLRETARAKLQSDKEQNEVVEALTTALTRLAEKNLEYRIQAEFPPVYAGLRETYNSATVALCEALGAVRVGASSLSNAIDEIRTASDDLARRNEQQAANLKETTAAMNQVNASVQETAGSAARVRTAMEQTQSEAVAGSAVVADAVAAMAAIEKSTLEITQITNLIDGIAFQTNLLALNAGVEAARAGDAGKGFAVVANEVRALAQRSADAAGSIKTLIAASTRQVEAGVALVGQSGEKLGLIAARVDEVTGLINEIATAAQHQAANLGQVNDSVAEMDRMTQRNAAMVEQTSAATRSLSAEATQLHGLVKAFQTRDRTSRPQHGAEGQRQRRHSNTEPARPRAVPRPAAIAASPPAAPRPAPPPAALPAHGNLALAEPDMDDWSEF